MRERAEELRRERLDRRPAAGRASSPASTRCRTWARSLLLWLGAWRVSDGAHHHRRARAGDGALRASSPSRSASSGSSSRSCPRAVVAHDRITGVLRPRSATEPAQPRPLPAGRPARRRPRRRAASPTRTTTCSTDVSAHVDAGEVVALVGSTGSGKSTLCTLLVHLIDPDGGTIRDRRRPPRRGGPGRAPRGGGAGVPGVVPLRRHRAREPGHGRATSPTTSSGPPSTSPERPDVRGAAAATASTRSSASAA